MSGRSRVTRYVYNKFYWQNHSFDQSKIELRHALLPHIHYWLVCRNRFYLTISCNNYWTRSNKFDISPIKVLHIKRDTGFGWLESFRVTDTHDLFKMMFVLVEWTQTYINRFTNLNAPFVHYDDSQSWNSI